MIHLNYEDLLKNYDQILTSTSRGFDTEHEFLESWVPNTDINQSISDLINSAIEYNITEFELTLTEDLVKNINIENLKNKFSKDSMVKLEKNKIIFNKIN